jgi:hypothetical protein
MKDWMLRGLVFAGGMVVLRLIQGAAINAWQTQSALISIVLLALFVIAVAIWGFLDGRADATANPDPDRRRDLAMTWLLAGLVAGILSGAVSWLISLVYEAVYTGGLINEVTTFAAFTALLVLLPGIVGAAVGRWRVDRNGPPVSEGDSDHRPADTDVFSAVRAEQRSAVATAERETEREAPTETIATGETEAPTESFKLPGRWGGPSAGEDKQD